MITLIFLMSGITALTIFEPGIDFLDLTYEAASAMGTVGLTADLTPILSRGKSCDPYDPYVCRKDRTAYYGACIIGKKR